MRGMQDPEEAAQWRTATQPPHRARGVGEMAGKDDKFSQAKLKTGYFCTMYFLRLRPS